MPTFVHEFALPTWSSLRVLKLLSLLFFRDDTRHKEGEGGREGGRSDVIVLNRKQLVNNPFRMIILFERREIIFESFLFFL